MKRNALWLAGVLIFGVVSCGPQEPTGGSATAPTSQQPFWQRPPASGQDWKDPIMGEEMSSIADAAKNLGFEPLVPKALGTPTKIFVQLSNPDPSQRVVAFVYENGTYGPVVVKEWLPPGSPADYAEFLASTAAVDDPATPGHRDSVTIRSGSIAMLTETDDRLVAGIRWVEGNIVVDIDGPSINREEVLTIANAL